MPDANAREEVLAADLLDQAQREDNRTAAFGREVAARRAEDGFCSLRPRLPSGQCRLLLLGSGGVARRRDLGGIAQLRLRL